MILTYSHDRFPVLIENKIKIHTIREDKYNRWKAGNSIQHWMHNPRNVSKNPYQFAKDVSDLNKCISVQKISIILTKAIDMIEIDGRELDPSEFDVLARHDGFDSFRQMKKWFKESIIDWKIIHWTNYKY